MTTKAEFSCALPSGGAFYASWPEQISGQSLRVAYAMLSATMEMWIDDADQRSAGEREYRSWQATAP